MSERAFGSRGVTTWSGPAPGASRKRMCRNRYETLPRYGWRAMRTNTSKPRTNTSKGGDPLEPPRGYAAVMTPKEAS
jgi:hypothetical protein